MRGREKRGAASGSHVASVRALFDARFGVEELAQLAELFGRLSGVGGADAGRAGPDARGFGHGAAASCSLRFAGFVAYS